MISPPTAIGPAGGELTLTCFTTISGPEIPMFEWLHNNADTLPNPSSVAPVSDTQGRFSSQITLNPLSQPAHGGMITCRVTLENSTAPAPTSVTVIVTGKLFITSMFARYDY